MKAVAELVALAQGGALNGYTNDAFEQKETFHRRAKTVAKLVAQELGLPAGSFDIRSNKGGIAVCGEVTLHSDTLYVQFSQPLFNGSFLYRSCRGRKDYTGGPNQWMKWSELLDFKRACQSFRATAGLAQPEPAPVIIALPPLPVAAAQPKLIQTELLAA